ncbi:MAG: AAA family ATPase [Lachnospiraceae bacterium]|nr:AAA family ATPase [Lachnospiraceae bacterium]
MNIKRAKQEIKDAVDAYLLKDEYGVYEIPTVRQRPILLLGAPGIGKTQIMEQIARECGIGLVAYTITHHTRQSAIGLPFITEKEYGGRKMAVTEYTMSEIVASIFDKMERTGLEEGILFIDEINCVSETLAPAMLQFLQCKTFGSHQIPQGWIIVAAGNPPEYNKSVREFDVVTMDRVKKIQVEPDFGVWKEYAAQVHIHSAILSYLNLRPQYFYHMENTVDGRCFATPRGWEDLSRLLEVYEKLGKQVDKEVAGQYLQHERIARDFSNYLELYYKYERDYRIQEILAGRIQEDLLKKIGHAPFDERVSVTGLLLSGCTRQFRKLHQQERFVERLFGNLKEVGKVLKEDERAGAASWELLDKMQVETEELREKKKEAGLLDREEEHELLRLSETLSTYGNVLKKEVPEDGNRAFDRLRELFQTERDCYEKLFHDCKECLEHAFDFMEAAFGDSQEMVIFLTELNTDRAAAAFLQEYACERYDRYNQRLLFEKCDREILEEIRTLS